jgi:hypothetical protein
MLIGQVFCFMPKKLTSRHLLDVTTVFCQARLDAALHVVGGVS